MNKLAAVSLLCGAAAVFSPIAKAANEGDTHTTSVTTCSYGGSTCTTTITEMTYVNGQWVIVSIKTVVSPRIPVKER